MCFAVFFAFLALTANVNCHTNRQGVVNTQLNVVSTTTLTADIQYDGQEATSPNITSPDIDSNIVKDRYSLREFGTFLGSKKLDNNPQIPNPACQKGDSAVELRNKVMASISRALNFQQGHSEDYPYMVDFSLAAAILQGVDPKHRMHFQKMYPIKQWTDQLCNGSGDIHLDARCRGLVQTFSKPRAEFKSLNISMDLNDLGVEKEILFSLLNEKCLDALLERCEVPAVCEQVMFDPHPKSQYMLSHQLLFRILAEDRIESCGLPKRLVDDAVNDNMCSKMYKETELIWQLQPDASALRDLFAENIAFCGHLGYTNFFRADWIEALLSWQSKSDYGCFLRDNRQTRVVNSDKNIPRKSTSREMESGAPVTNEICNPHFTAVGLSALAVSWDYLERAC